MPDMIPDATFPLPEKWIRDVETIKVFADPLRLKIIREMEEPATVKQVSAALDIPVGKLYYHANLLAKHDLIQVVAHNLESGIVEKVYQVTARDFKLVNPLLVEDFPADATDALFSDMLSEAGRGLQRALAARDGTEGTPPRHPFVSQKRFRLTDHQLTELHGRFITLIEEVTARGEANQAGQDPEYELTVAFYRRSDSD